MAGKTPPNTMTEHWTGATGHREDEMQIQSTCRRTQSRKEARISGDRMATHRPVLWRLLRVLQQRHALVLEVPQERRVVQPPLAGDGLRVAAELAVPEDVV